jgi:hypothetical protein
MADEPDLEEVTDGGDVAGAADMAPNEDALASPAVRFALPRSSSELGPLGCSAPSNRSRA